MSALPRPGGHLVRTERNRTVVDANGHRVLMPNVLDALTRRAESGVVFIVSNQARIGRGEIGDADVRRFAWLDAQLGGPFTDRRLCPHGDGDGRESWAAEFFRW